MLHLGLDAPEEAKFRCMRDALAHVGRKLGAPRAQALVRGAKTRCCNDHRGKADADRNTGGRTQRRIEEERHAQGSTILAEISRARPRLTQPRTAARSPTKRMESPPARRFATARAESLVKCRNSLARKAAA